MSSAHACKFYVSLASAILLFNCAEKEQGAIKVNSPIVTPAKGFVAPPEKTAAPVIIPLRNENRVTAGKFRVTKIQSNIFPLGKPSIIPAGTARICTPGKDSFKLPERVTADSVTIVSGIPEVVEVKDPQDKDNNPASFSTFKILQGLRNNLIFSLKQDHAGNIWIGTFGGGISRYDGRMLTNYTTSEGLCSDMIYSIIEDSNQNLWVGTNDGVSKFDGAGFTNFKIPGKSGSRNVWNVQEDKKGNIWFGTNGGLVRFDGKTFVTYSTDQGLPGNSVFCVFLDTKGIIWLGTDKGISRFNGESFLNFNNPAETVSSEIRKISEDPAGNIWFGTIDRGLCKYDGNSLTSIDFPSELSTNISGLIHNSDGKVWIGTYDDGVYLFTPGHNDSTSGNITRFGTAEGLSDQFVYCALKDNSGNLWFGTGNGVCKYKGNLFTHINSSHGLSNESIRDIYEDRKGFLWIGTWGGGVNRYRGDSIMHITTEQGLSNNNVHAITEDSKGNMWFGTWGGGINKFDGKSFKWYSTDQGLISNLVSKILEDSKGNIWVATVEGGISKFDGSSFTNYSIKQGLSSSDVFTIIEDQKGNFWLGTNGGGICRFDGKTFTQYNDIGGLNNVTVFTIAEDKKTGDLWIGTSNHGVIRFDGKTFTNYTTAHGLSNNFVTSAMIDDNNDIWFGTINGLSRLKQNKPVGNQASYFKNYLFSDGFLGVGTWYDALIQSKTGVIWSGTSDRITAYHREGDIPDIIPPAIQLTSVDLFTEKIDWSGFENHKDTSLLLSNNAVIRNVRFQKLSNWYPIPENLSLSYKNNYLTFQFIGVSTRRPGDIKYQYFMEGLDENWTTTSTPEATYNNLPHGSYVFTVRAINSEGYESKDLSYPFVIRPPWWHTIWAYIAYLGIFIVSLWAFIRYRSRKLKAENIELERKVSDRTRELQQSLSALKQTQVQLIQSEKMASLGELTAGIAHEIQNPLNFMNNFSDVNKDLLIELKEDIDKGNYNDAKLIADDLISNEEKINHHGKRADSIVKGMLQHSRKSTGEKELTDINALADEYLRLAFHGMRARDKSFNVNLKTEFDPSGGKINLVSQDIARALLNLYNNAFQSVAEKAKNNSTFSPEISVITKRMNGQLHITVKDNGMGISEKVISKIFQPFFTTKPTGQGTGLGLSLAYDIVNAHGGKIEVNSTEGQGSEFQITLIADS